MFLRLSWCLSTAAQNHSSDKYRAHRDKPEVGGPGKIMGYSITDFVASHKQLAKGAVLEWALFHRLSSNRNEEPSAFFYSV